MSEWISVKDELPKKGVGCIGCLRLYYDGELDMSDHEFVMHVGNGVFKKHQMGRFVELGEDEEISDWMELKPLPEPPQ